MLLINGTRYQRWTPPTEQVLEDLVKANSRQVFGEKSIYFDLKHRLDGSEIASIPDGYAITLDPDKLWIVEVELSTHDVYGHIMPQLGKFLAALRKSTTRDRVCSVLFNEIDARDDFKEVLRSKGEIFKFLVSLLRQRPELAVIIDRTVPGLEDIEAALNGNVTICEFTAFRSGDVGPLVCQFEPIVQPADGWAGLWRELLDGVKRRGIAIKSHADNGRPYQPIWTGKAGIHFEWLAWGTDSLGVELHLQRPAAAESKKLLESFEQARSLIEERVGEGITFQYPWHKKWARLVVKRGAAEGETAPAFGPEMREWAIETMVKLYGACKPILDTLDV